MDPFRHGVGDDGSNVAGPEADGMQRVGDLLRYLQPFAPARRLPDPEFLLAYSRPVAPRLRGAQKAFRDGVSDLQHRLSGHARLLLVALPSAACLAGGLLLRTGILI